MYHEFPGHEGHIPECADGGAILYEEGTEGLEARLNGRRVHLMPLPYSKIVDEALTAVGKGGQPQEYRIMHNTAAIGASAGLLDFHFDRVTEVIMAGFEGKARRVGETNVNCARLAYEYVRKHFSGKLDFSLPSRPKETRKQTLIKGTTAVAICH